MAHNIDKMVHVGVEPWHGLGTHTPANGSYEDIVQAAGVDGNDHGGLGVVVRRWQVRAVTSSVGHA